MYALSSRSTSISVPPNLTDPTDNAVYSERHANIVGMLQDLGIILVSLYHRGLSSRPDAI